MKKKTLGHLLDELKELHDETAHVISEIEDLLDDDDDLYFDENEEEI
jgi:hypothetical protein